MNRRLVAVATGLWLVPAAALAEAAHGHGKVTLHEILAGDHSVGFWGAVVNFTLLCAILYVAARKPVQAFLSTRRSAMEEAMREAAEAKAKAEAKYQEYTARLAGLDQELAKLRADIERGAEEDKKRILGETEEATARLRRDTETLVRQHAEGLERRIRAEVVEAAIGSAERLLRERVGSEDQRRLAETYREQVAALAPEKAS